ncbi:MAG: leucine-rich repeat domain-containing protein [Clostridia bacterium]|nr:leucine-rich repeat domain-containing protein [Clostridia bacterium]
MRKMKKSLWIAVTVIALALLSVTFAFAAEGDCVHPNGYSEWVNGCNVFICDDCGLNECDHNNREELVNKDGKYLVCNNCGEIIETYCEHGEYEVFVDEDWYSQQHNVYCSYEYCSCYNYVKVEEHDFEFKKGSYDYNSEFVCKNCDSSWYVNNFAYFKTTCIKDKNGNCSGEWYSYNYTTGELNGSGNYTYSFETGALVINGNGYIDLYVILAHIGETQHYECDKCYRVWYEYNHNGAYEKVTSTAYHKELELADTLRKIVLGNGITGFNGELVEHRRSVSNVTELALPESFKEFGSGEYVFKNAEVNLPDDVEVLDYLNNKNLFVFKKGNISENNLYYTLDEYGNIYSKDMKILYKYQSEEKEFIVPSTVTEIAPLAFAFNNNVEKVKVPSSVKKIDDMGFALCENLKSVSLSYGLETIGMDAFGACFALEKIDIPNSVTEISSGAFVGCVSLKEVELSEKLTRIPDSAFGSCISLENIVIPSAVTEIESYAFSGCMSIKNLELPSGITTIGQGAFSDCIYLETLNIPSNNLELDGTEFGLISEQWINVDIEKFIDLMVPLYETEFRSNFEIVDECEFNKQYFEAYNLLPDKYGAEEIITEEGYYRIVPNTYTSELLTIYCHEGSTAEAYAIENGIKYVAEVCEHSFGEWVADAEKGIKYKTCSKCGKTYEEELTADGDNIGIEGNEGENKFTVQRIENPESTEYIYIRGLLEGNIIALYDINLLDENGNKVQPDGMVKVSLPLGEDVKYFTVLRINDDGTLTDMKAVREGDSVVFETDHFSYYVILGGETEADTGDNIKCNCFCHKHPLVELIVMLFKILTKFFGGPLTFYCDC